LEKVHSLLGNCAQEGQKVKTEERRHVKTGNKKEKPTAAEGESSLKEKVRSLKRTGRSVKVPQKPLPKRLKHYRLRRLGGKIASKGGKKHQRWSNGYRQPIAGQIQMSKGDGRRNLLRASSMERSRQGPELNTGRSEVQWNKPKLVSEPLIHLQP